MHLPAIYVRQQAVSSKQGSKGVRHCCHVAGRRDRKLRPRGERG
jgi:hypothetical protein